MQQQLAIGQLLVCHRRRFGRLPCFAIVVRRDKPGHYVLCTIGEAVFRDDVLNTRDDVHQCTRILPDPCSLQGILVAVRKPHSTDLWTDRLPDKLYDPWVPFERDAAYYRLISLNRT